MATKRGKALTDDELCTKLDGLIRRSVGWYSSTLSTERMKVMEFYEGERPLKSKRGQSSYISTDVYDSVEAMSAQLIETMASGRKIVQFAPKGPHAIKQAKMATAFADFVFFRQNPGENILQTVVKDGLLARAGVAMVYWDEAEELEPFELPEPVLLAQLKADPEIVVYDNELEDATPDGEWVTGKVCRKVDKSQIRIEAVPPNEFGCSQRARSLETAPLVYRRVKKTRAQLLAMGVPEGQIKKLGHDDEDLKDDEETVRFQSVEENGLDGDDTAEDADSFWCYECYVRHIDIDGKGARLWKVTKASNYVLSKEQVKQLPFVSFVPIKQPHRFWGSNYAARVIPVQLAKTALTRSIVDHTIVTNTPRWQIVNGTLRDPKELFDPRLGGGVNVNRPDGIIPLPQQPLNPFVFQTIALLDADNEDTTGISRLSQGLNKDALSQQNSGAMVEQLTSNSQVRQKVIARNLANDFLIPLYRMIYHLTIENEKQQRILDIAGDWVRVDPSQWSEEVDVVASLHLGYGEIEKQAQKWVGVHQMFLSSPAIAHMYGPDKQYAVLAKLLEVGGTPDIQTYLTPPDQAQPPPPNPEIAFKDREIKVKEAGVQLDKEQWEFEKTERQLKLKFEQSKVENKKTMDEAELALRVDKHEHDKVVDAAEIKVMQDTAKTAEKTAITAMASPN